MNQILVLSLFLSSWFSCNKIPPTFQHLYPIPHDIGEALPLVQVKFINHSNNRYTSQALAMDLITGTEYENLAPSTSLSPLDMVKLLTEHSRKSIKENNTFERQDKTRFKLKETLLTTRSK